MCGENGCCNTRQRSKIDRRGEWSGSMLGDCQKYDLGDRNIHVSHSEVKDTSFNETLMLILDENSAFISALGLEFEHQDLFERVWLAT